MKKYPVFQSPLAEKKFLDLLKYLEEEWGEKSKLTFIEKFKSSIETISILPKSFPLSQSKFGLYKCVITRQTSIYYRINNEEIEIITLMDNRRDQAKLFDELKKYFSQ